MGHVDWSVAPFEIVLNLNINIIMQIYVKKWQELTLTVIHTWYVNHLNFCVVGPFSDWCIPHIAFYSYKAIHESLLFRNLTESTIDSSRENIDPGKCYVKDELFFFFSLFEHVQISRLPRDIPIVQICPVKTAMLNLIPCVINVLTYIT